MPITLDDLTNSVNTELENRTHYGNADVVADGVITEWCIAPLGYSILNDGDFLCLKDGSLQTEPTNYTMNFDNGVCSFVTAPALGTSLKWYFNYNQWSDSLVYEAINAGIQSLFPDVYYEFLEEITTDGETFEYDLTEPVEFIKSYDFKETGGTSWTRKKSWDYELFRDDTHKVISFFDAPSAGTVRVHAIGRPQALVGTTDDLPTTAHIADRFAFPIVSYACYYLLTQKMAPRTRSDVAVATQGKGTLSPRQMGDSANAFYLRHQMQLRSMKMPPWSMR